MSNIVYLKDWEAGSSVSKIQGDLLGDLQRVLEADNLPKSVQPVEPAAGPARVPPGEEAQEQFAARLGEREKELESMLDNVSDCRKHIDSLKKYHEELMSRTNDFQSRCGSILKEQRTLADICEELTKSLEYYKEVDAIGKTIAKKSSESLLSEEGFPKMLDTLETAESFFTQNPDYLDSKEYLVKITNIKRKLGELIQTHVQQCCIDYYSQKWTTAQLTQEAATLYKVNTYGSIDSLDKIRPNFLLLQGVAKNKHVPEYVDTVDNAANFLFAVRRNIVTALCDLLRNDALQSDKISAVAQKLLQIQATFIRDERCFFSHYFEDIERISKDISAHFETIVYNSLRPLIIQEQDVAELSAAIMFTKKAFFDRTTLLPDYDGDKDIVDKKFLTKERLLYLLDNYITERLKQQPGDSEEVKHTFDAEGKDTADPNFGISTIIRIYDFAPPGVVSAIELLKMCDGCLDRQIVASVSIEIIRPCTQYLERHKGAVEPAWKKQAFMVKNLYYLLDKLKSFNIELISHEEGLDFSYTKESIIGLLYGPKKLKEYNWLGFISDTLPKLQQSQRDLKKDLIKRFDEHMGLLISTLVSMTIPHVIRYLTLTETEAAKPDRVQQLQRLIKDKSASESKDHPELSALYKDEIKRLMTETQTNIYEGLVGVLRLIEQNFAGEAYTRTRNELLITVTQEITKCVQKWYDRLAGLLDTPEYDGLGLPNIKLIYETVSKAIATLASSSSSAAVTKKQ